MASTGLIGAVFSLMMTVRIEAMMFGDPFGFQNMIQPPTGPMGPMSPMGPMGPIGPIGPMGPMGPMGPQMMGPNQQGPFPVGSCACQGGVCAKLANGESYCVCLSGHSLDRTKKICLRDPPCPSKPCTNGKCYLSYYDRMPECVCDQGFKISATDSAMCESITSAGRANNTSATRQCTSRRCRNGSCQTVSAGVTKCICNLGFSPNASGRCTATASPTALVGPAGQTARAPPAGAMAPGLAGAQTNNRAALTNILDMDPADLALLSSRTPQQAYMRYMMLGEI